MADPLQSYTAKNKDLEDAKYKMEPWPAARTEAAKLKDWRSLEIAGHGFNGPVGVVPNAPSVNPVIGWISSPSSTLSTTTTARVAADKAYQRLPAAQRAATPPPVP